METLAWQHLSGNAAKLLLLILKLYNGENNGQIVLGQREGSLALGVARNTIAAAFDELETKGFIRPARKGSFSQKYRRATEWRVTMWPAFDKAATHEYREWTPDCDC
ncbi:hypothetical protein [Sphingobium yanoikuyae]|uniref:hypothetical protein n=1 Tax=Sphingobium yanoikuyae TaxID=13690 RepID=UPI0035B372E9